MKLLLKTLRWHPEGTDKLLWKGTKKQAALSSGLPSRRVDLVPVPHRIQLSRPISVASCNTPENLSPASLSQRPSLTINILNESGVHFLNQSMDTPVLQWGIIGAAQIARKFAAAVLSSPGSKLVSVASRSNGKAASFIDKVLSESKSDQMASEISVHLCYEDMLADPSVDAVYIPLPNDMHAEWIEKALSCGKHVLVEKPAVLYVSEARNLLDAYISSRRHLSEGMPFLFNPLFDQVLSEASSMGALKRVTCAFCHPLSARGPECIAMQKNRGGGSLYALGCYVIAAALRLCPAILESDCEPVVINSKFYAPQVDLTLAVRFSTPSGCILDLECSIDENTPKTQKLEIECEFGSISVPNLFISSDSSIPSCYTVRKLGFPDEIKEAPPCDSFLAEVQDFELVVANLSGDNAAGRSIQSTASCSSNRDVEFTAGAHPFIKTIEQIIVMEKIARCAGIMI